MFIPIHVSRAVRQLHTNNITKEISSVITKLHNNPPKCYIPGTGALSLSRENNKIFFSVHKSMQQEMNFIKARQEILSHLQLPIDTKIVQVIGDCIPFSYKGTEKSRDIIASVLSNPNQLLLWGYTGSKKEDGRRLDINQLLNEWVDACETRGSRVLANVLDVDTIKALTEWECLGSKTVKNFYLVYGDATFGDDIASSDFITDEACCFDGGMQSFRQMMNLLMRGITIQCYYGFRHKEYTPIREKYSFLFSASHFLKVMKDNIKVYYEYNDLAENEIPSNMETLMDCLEGWKDQYLKLYPLYNRQVRDFDSRQVLFQAGWDLFLEKQLWRKLELCQFLDIQTDNADKCRVP